MAVTHLDGRTPALVVCRGTYTRIQVHAFRFRNGALERIWELNSLQEAEPRVGYGCRTSKPGLFSPDPPAVTVGSV